MSLPVSEPRTEPTEAAVSTAEREGNLADHAYARLSGMILQKKLPGGTFVIEGRLALQLDISRTPMREAILRLAAEGLLVKQGARSYAVRRVEPTEFFQALKVRELLEGDTIEAAAGRVPAAAIASVREAIMRVADLPVQEAAHWDADDRLHLMFADALGNAVLGRIIRQLRVSTRLFEITSPYGRVAADAEEHLEILDRFAKGDAKGARRAMMKHLRNLSAEILALVQGG